MLSEMAQEIKKFLADHGRVDIRQIMKGLGYSHEVMVKIGLNELIDAGFVVIEDGEFCFIGGEKDG